MLGFPVVGMALVVHPGAGWIALWVWSISAFAESVIERVVLRRKNPANRRPRGDPSGGYTDTHIEPRYPWRGMDWGSC